MQVIVLKENLIKALSVVSRFVSSRPQLPILSNILLKAKDNQLIFSATNMELGIIFRIGAKIEKEGETTVAGRLLTEFIANITGDKIDLSIKDSTLLIKTNNTQASFTTISSSDFPPFPVFSDTKKTLPLEKIKDSIMHTVFAASSDESRPVLTGVRVIADNEKIHFVATDGYRLSMEQIDVPEIKEEIKVILPAQTLAEIVRIGSELKEKEVGFSIIENKNQAVFVFGDVLLFSRIIEGEFPNIEKIIPREFKTKAIIEKERFLQAVKTASLFAKGAANIVKIKLEKDGLWLSANSPQVGEDKDFIEAKTEGEDMETAFNYRFLLDLLTNFPDKEVVFESSGQLSPGVFKSTTPSSSFLHLIMPVRVQG